MRVQGATIEARARAARLDRAGLPNVPYRHGKLRVTGEVLSTLDSGDLFDVVEDATSRTSVLLVGAKAHGTAAAIVASAVRAELRGRLANGRALVECIEAVDHALRAVATDAVPSVGFGIVRVSADETTVECVNAGLPPIVVASGGATLLVEARYETFHVTSDTVFLLASDGLAPATIGDEAFRRVRALLEQDGTRIASARVGELRRVIVETAALRGDGVDEASLVIAAVLK